MIYDKKIYIFFFLLYYSSSYALESRIKCKDVIEKFTEYKFEGNYGNSTKKSLEPVFFYKLIKEMKTLKVVKREFREKNGNWYFEFIILNTGNTIVFIGNKIKKYDSCKGSNSLYVSKKN